MTNLYLTATTTDSVSMLATFIPLILMIVIGVLYRWKQKWHPIIFIALGAVAGLVLGL